MACYAALENDYNMLKSLGMHLTTTWKEINQRAVWKPVFVKLHECFLGPHVHAPGLFIAPLSATWPWLPPGSCLCAWGVVVLLAE